MLLLTFEHQAFSQTYAPGNDTVLHIFDGAPTDGALPAGGVVFDTQGNLYGATTYGGNGGSDCIGASCGTVYELSPSGQSGGSWTETILYNFTGENFDDGQLPNGGLIIDGAGNLYGVTAYGGTGNCILLGGSAGCGTVYEVAPPSQPGGAWTKTTLYSFQGRNDGYLPIGNLTFDQLGNLYGATQYGGGFGSCNAPLYQYCGTVFEISPPKTTGAPWTEKVLYSFKGESDGANPNGGLIFDKAGQIYGTTYFGGLVPSGTRSGQYCAGQSGGSGCGTVFRLRSSVSGDTWMETILYRFRGAPDGATPAAGVTADQTGTLYGTTTSGGINREGTVYWISAPDNLTSEQPWAEGLVYSFAIPTGSEPSGALIHDGKGRLYGTALNGGSYLSGVIFRLEPNSTSGWTYSVLCDFPTGNQAAGPSGELTFDGLGSIYGISQIYDHLGNGSVFKLGP